MAQGPRTDGEEPSYHLPVLAAEVVAVFKPLVAGVVVDATFGGGGHTRRLLDELEKGIQIVAIDRDPDALANARKIESDAVTVVRGNFGDLGRLLDEAQVTHPVGFLFDLGVSSHQIDRPERGFSYRHDGPLDMRMGPDAEFAADEIINQWEAGRLAEVIRRYGEVPAAGRVAAAIVAARPIRSTAHLADVIAEATPAALRRKRHPARRTFQALRIAVNDELGALRAGLDQAVERLAPGGRCAVISYHSLEDRIVKQRFQDGARGCVCPPEMPVCACDAAAELRILTRRPIEPDDEEVGRNPRARSAKMRVAEKLASTSGAAA